MPRPAERVRRGAVAVAAAVAVGMAATGTAGPAPGAAAVDAVALTADAGTGRAAVAAERTALAARPAPAAPAAPGPPVAVQVLAVNDFHGALEPPDGEEGRIAGAPAGGAEHLAARLAELSAQAAPGATVTVAAGDLVGAAPLLSAAFHDEPAVESLGLAGLDLAGVGNHEFDEGVAELLRLQFGGCHPVDGCADPARPYAGARFRYLAANAVSEATGGPVLPPYAVQEVAGVRIGFIGLTLEATPQFTTPSGVRGVRFTDEVETGNRYARELQALGVEAIVVLLHEGGAQDSAAVDGCTRLRGPVVPIAEGLSPAVDVVLTGHTHQPYTCVLGGKVVTSAASAGRVVTDVDLLVDPGSGHVLSAAARNVPVRRDGPPDPAQTALIARYRALLGPRAAPVVGTATTPITRAQEPLPGGPAGESALGNLLADAQLAATADRGAVAAFAHPGAARADLAAGPVTAAAALAVQPYNSALVTLELTGAELDCLLEQQFTTGLVLQPSAGLTYAVDPAGTTAPPADPCAGTRAHDLAIGGAPVDPAAGYRVTVADYLADGDDGFTVLTRGRDRTTGPLDVEALSAHLSAAGPVAAPATDRIAVR